MNKIYIHIFQFIGEAQFFYIYKLYNSGEIMQKRQLFKQPLPHLDWFAIIKQILPKFSLIFERSSPLANLLLNSRDSQQFIINEYMKNNQYLSQFQKEQYTTYLEGQLEKFSAFMLAQRKENEKYKSIEDILSQHQKSIGQMKDQIELLEVYQHQNLQNCEHINKKMAKVEELQHQFYRFQDRYRPSAHGTIYNSSYHESEERSSKQQFSKEIEFRVAKLEKCYPDLQKRMINIQDEIDRNRELIIGICKSKAVCIQDEAELYANHKDLKKLQKKMHKYFDQKFTEIEGILKKSQRKRSKSPSFRTPIECVNSYSSSAEQTQKILSQFKINEQSSLKSDFSTLSRDTKNTPLSSQTENFRKSKRNKSKSKSKSKKHIKQSKSKSKKSISAQKSSISKSKSKISRNESILNGPLKLIQQKSASKSRRSSLSCGKHEKNREGKSMMKKRSKKCPESCGSRCI